MLPDQEIQLVGLILGRGRTVFSLAYIHRNCTYDVVIKDKKEGAADLNVFALLDRVTELVRGLGGPYWALWESLRPCRWPSVTLTLDEIETIIGFRPDWEAHYF